MEMIIKSGPGKHFTLIPTGRSQPDNVNWSGEVSGNAAYPKESPLDLAAHGFTAARVFAPPGIREILGELPLNSDIVGVFYMGVGGFLHLPG